MNQPLRIGIDLRFTAASLMGTGVYAENETLALVQALQPGDTLMGFVDEPLHGPLAEALPLVVLSHRIGGHDAMLGLRLLFDAAIEKADLDVFWSPAGIAPCVTSGATVITIHDLWFEHEPAHYHPQLAAYLHREIPRSIMHADGIIAISSSTAHDVAARFPDTHDRMCVVQQGLRSSFRTRPDAQTAAQSLAAVGLHEPYILTLTNHAPHKNTAFVLEIFALWIRQSGNATFRLVVAGGGPSPHPPEDLHAVAERLGIAERVIWAGRVPELGLPSLMSCARVFLYPSLFEGWGLPPVEAMAMGTPTMVSDRGGLPEAVGAGALILSLDHPQPWVDALAHVVDHGLTDVQRAAMLTRVQSLLQPSGLAIRNACAAAYARRHGADFNRQQARTAFRAGTPKRPTIPADAVRIPMRRTRTGLTVCTMVRNGVDLDYPLVESMASYAAICDDIILAWDPTSTDATKALVERCAMAYPMCRLLESPWNMSNRQGGSELAIQTNIALAQSQSPWTMYIQADEALHEDDHALILGSLTDETIVGIGCERRSFLGSLDREIIAHRVSGLVRIFRTGFGRSVGDAMSCEVNADRGRILVAPIRLFNYSRMGSAPLVGKRTINLHRFYHDDEAAEQKAQAEVSAEASFATEGFEERHPAPIERRFRTHMTAPPMGPRAGARIAVNIIAREQDAFGIGLFRSCLESLSGYAEQIVVIDNGLSEEARAMVQRLRTGLPIELHDGRHHRSFADIRNHALAKTHADVDYVHKIDTDEVYVPDRLEELRAFVSEQRPDRASSQLIHFMIDPTLIESIQDKAVIFKRTSTMSWTGNVHECLVGGDGIPTLPSPGTFLHFGYCRPQWQIFLKWLHYAQLQNVGIAPYQYEIIDGVRLPWFHHGRTPDTILESRRPILKRYGDPYPLTIKPWLDAFAHSRQPWRSWLAGMTDDAFWQRWQSLMQRHGSWEATLPIIIAQVPSHQARTAASSH